MIVLEIRQAARIEKACHVHANCACERVKTAIHKSSAIAMLFSGTIVLHSSSHRTIPPLLGSFKPPENYDDDPYLL